MLKNKCTSFDTLPFKMLYNCLRNYDRKASWCKQCQNKAAKANRIKKKTLLLSQIQDNELPFEL